MQQTVGGGHDRRGLFVAGVSVGHNWLDLHLPIDPAEPFRAGNGLGHARSRVLFLVQHLPLQVVPFNEVAIYES